MAEVAAIALTEDHLNHGTYELCAEGNLNRHGVAALMSGALRRTVKAAKLEISDAAPDPSGPGADEQATLKAMFQWYDAHGMLGNALTLRAILGREPRTLRAYLEEISPAS